MKQRRRIYYSAAQRSEIWDRWQAGEPMSSIGRRFDRESSSVFSVISPTGGIRPPDRRRAKQALSLSEREEISRWLSMRCSLRSIACHLGRSPSTISREVERNGGADRYRAARSDLAGWDRARRPKLCKLACRPFLRRTVSTLLQRQWSPEQIAGWLKRTYPGEPEKQVSHETIYRSLLPFAAGFDAICIAALVWLDARKSLALEYDCESLDTPSRDESDQDRTRGKADAESERIDETQFRDKYRSNTHADSNSPTDRIDSDSEKSSAADANADKARLIPVTVVDCTPSVRHANFCDRLFFILGLGVLG